MNLMFTTGADSACHMQKIKIEDEKTCYNESVKTIEEEAINGETKPELSFSSNLKIEGYASINEYQEDEIKIEHEVTDSTDESDPLQEPNHETYSQNEWLVENSQAHKIEASQANSQDTDSRTSDKKFACESCGMTFTTKGSANRHAITHKGRKPFSCDFCSQAFYQPYNLKRHIMTKHKKGLGSRQNLKLSEDSGAQIKNETSNDPLLEMNPLLEINDDTAKLDDAVLLGNDVPNGSLIHHGEMQCYLQTKTRTKKIRKDQNRDRDRSMTERYNSIWPFPCDLCDARFTVKNSLFRHRLTHTDQVFSCATCQAKFLTKTDLSQHITKIHPKNCLPNHPLYSEIIEIDDSPNDSSQTEVIRIHDEPVQSELIPAGPSGNMMDKKRDPGDEVVNGSSPNNTVQSDVGPSRTKKHRIRFALSKWICQTCGCKCKGPINLMEHMTVHTREDPFACDSCSFKTRRSSLLLKHKRVWHDLYTCNLCNYKTKSKRLFRFHNESHNDRARCMVCDFSSTIVEEVSEHYSKTHLHLDSNATP